ncbi:MAG: hypothetical protein AAF383_19760 [Cyanobacteria bacterium P01_A01_bin.83]
MSKPKFKIGDRVGILYFDKGSIHTIGTVVDSFYLPERAETYWFIDEKYQLMGGQTIYIVEYDWQKAYGTGATLIDEQDLVSIEKSANVRLPLRTGDQNTELTLCRGGVQSQHMGMYWAFKLK